MAQQLIGPSRYAQSTSGPLVNANFTELYGRAKKADLPNTSANVTFVVPAGFMIEHLGFQNTTANAVTGGVRIGTSSGGADVLSATPVSANQLTVLPGSAYGTRIFSTTADTTLYLQAVTSWNSANVNFEVIMRKLF